MKFKMIYNRGKLSQRGTNNCHVSWVDFTFRVSSSVSKSDNNFVKSLLPGNQSFHGNAEIHAQPVLVKKARIVTLEVFNLK